MLVASGGNHNLTLEGAYKLGTMQSDTNHLRNQLERERQLDEREQANRAYERQLVEANRQREEANRTYERQLEADNRTYERQLEADNRAYERQREEASRAYERQQNEELKQLLRQQMQAAQAQAQAAQAQAAQAQAAQAQAPPVATVQAGKVDPPEASSKSDPEASSKSDPEVVSKLDAILNGVNNIGHGVTNLGHEVRTAVKAPRSTQTRFDGSPTVLFGNSNSTQDLCSRLVEIVHKAASSDPRSMQADRIDDLLRSVGFNTEDYKNADDKREAIQIAADMLQNTSNKPFMNLNKFLPDSVIISVADPATMAILRHALKPSDSPYANLKTSVGITPVGSRGDSVVFVTAYDENKDDSVDEDDPFDDDGFAPSKLVSSGHLWQRYGREAFGLTKTYTVSWTFHDKEQVHLEFAAVLTDHCKEIISEVVEVLLGDNTELSLRKEVLRIEFQKVTLNTDQQDVFSVKGCASKLVFTNAVLDGGGTSLLPLDSKKNKLSVEFLDDFPSMNFLKEGVKHRCFSLLTMNCSGFGKDAVEADHTLAASGGQRCLTQAADSVEFSGGADCFHYMKLFETMGEKGLALSIGKFDPTCSFNICSFHGPGRMPHSSNTENITAAVFNKVGMEYFRGEHKKGGKMVR